MAGEFDKRAVILDAAEQAFGVCGFAKAKMSGIAEKAGIGKGTIYLYFRSKQELFASLVEERLKEYATILSREVAQAENLDELLEAVIRTRLEFYLQHRGLVDSIWGALTSIDGDWKQKLAESQQFMRDIVGRALWKFNPDLAVSTATAVDAIFGSTSSAIAFRILSREPVDPSAMVSELVALLLPGLQAQAQEKK